VVSRSDHLVGAEDKRLRRPSAFAVLRFSTQLELCWLFNRKIGRFCAFEYFVKSFNLHFLLSFFGHSLLDPSLSPFVNYQDRAISPQRDKDVRLNSVAALPSEEISHSCSSFSVLGRRPLTPSKSSVGLSPLPFVD
jgi:hypothetical protein